MTVIVFQLIPAKVLSIAIFFRRLKWQRHLKSSHIITQNPILNLLLVNRYLLFFYLFVFGARNKLRKIIRRNNTQKVGIVFLVIAFVTFSSVFYLHRIKFYIFQSKWRKKKNNLQWSYWWKWAPISVEARAHGKWECVILLDKKCECNYLVEFKEKKIEKKKIVLFETFWCWIYLDLLEANMEYHYERCESVSKPQPSELDLWKIMKFYSVFGHSQKWVATNWSQVAKVTDVFSYFFFLFVCSFPYIFFSSYVANVKH